MALSARVPHTPLGRLLAILAMIVAADLIVASAVLVDRLDDPDIPDFNRASLAQLRWDVSPYSDPSPLLGFPSEVTRPDRSGSPERQALDAIAALARYDRTQDRRWLRRARTAVDGVLSDTTGGLVMHRTPTISLLGDPVEVPWYSAQTQGMLLSALARLEEATGSQRLRASADEVFAALMSFQGFFAGSKPAPVHWLSSIDSSGYLWFDQFSTGLSSSSVLTEQLWTAFGIYDYRRVLADRRVERRLARDLFAGSLATVANYLPKWRVQGQISISSLLAGNRDVRSHFEAETQLAILAKIIGGGWAERAAGQFDRDDNVPFFPVKPVSTEAVLDAYDPLPPELASLARSGRPQRLASPGVPPQVSQADDPLRQSAEALELLAGPTDQDRVRRAAELVTRVMSTADNGAVPHRATLRDVSGERVKGPWFSSASQGLLLSALTRLHERTGQPRWRRDAAEVFTALTRVRDYGGPSTQPWFGLIDFSGNLYFDQNLGASTPPRSIYEHMTALVGLYDYWRMTQDGAAYAYFAGGVTTLRDAFPLIRKRGRPAVESIASGESDPEFHDLIAAQTEALAAITRDKRLSRFARLLREDYP